MILEHYTPADLLQVQQAGKKALHNNNISDDENTTNNSGCKIKYLVLNKGSNGKLMVFAQATAKMTMSAWHRCFGYCFKDIQPPIDNHEALSACLNKENSAVCEEYGITPHYHHKAAGVVMLGPQHDEVSSDHVNNQSHPSVIDNKISKETHKKERRVKKWLQKARKQLCLPEPHIVSIVVAAYKLQSSLFEDSY